MGRHRCKKDKCTPKHCPVQVCENIVFNIRAGSGNTPQICTSLFFSRGKNTATLQWCTFGGVGVEGQTSTTAQNFCIPLDSVPPCDQTFVISGSDNNLGQYRTMNIIIRTDGTVSFLYNLNPDQTENTFPIFNGSTVTWITFGCPSTQILCC